MDTLVASELEGIVEWNQRSFVVMCVSQGVAG